MPTAQLATSASCEALDRVLNAAAPTGRRGTAPSVAAVAFIAAPTDGRDPMLV